MIKRASRALNICGPMGVGKTTLVNAIAYNYGLPIIKEHFREVPYWREAYTGKNPDFMKMQIAFLSQYLRNIEHMKKTPVFIADNQFYAGLAFITAQHKLGLVSDLDFGVYLELFEALDMRFPVDVETIVLLGSTDTVYSRVRCRNREEEESVSVEYVEALIESWEKLAEERGFTVINTDTLAEHDVPEIIQKALSEKKDQHYKQGGIQPVEYIMANNLDFCAGNIVKYVTRLGHKGTPLEDLRKIIKYCEILMEEYGEK